MPAKKYFTEVDKKEAKAFQAREFRLRENIKKNPEYVKTIIRYATEEERHAAQLAAKYRYRNKYRGDLEYENNLRIVQQRAYNKLMNDEERLAKKRIDSLERRRRDPIGQMYKAAKSRSKRSGLEFTIELDDMPKLPKFCPILGIELESGAGKKHTQRNSYSFDRINNEKGYVIGNIAIISALANSLKNSFTIEQLDNLHRYINGNLNNT